MTAEAKLRTLAAADATLQGFFGTGPFRWFDRVLPPHYIDRGACCRVRRVSTVRQYAHATREAFAVSGLAQPRFQFDVLDTDPVRGASAAEAIRDWITARVNCTSGEQFATPPTSPRRHPNVILNELDGIEPQTDPPIFVRILDVRIFDLEE